MDEEYDVRIASSQNILGTNSASIGYCSRNRFDRMYPLRIALCRGQEGPSHGQERLLRRGQC